MFCDLNGATRTPSRWNIRQSPVTRRLLPTDDAVPWIMRVRANIGGALLSARRAGDLRLRAGARRGGHGPAGRTRCSRGRAPDGARAADGGTRVRPPDPRGRTAPTPRCVARGEG